MLESEAICNRIGILTNGSLECLGSLDELKDRFGNYTIITIKMMPCPVVSCSASDTLVG